MIVPGYCHCRLRSRVVLVSDGSNRKRRRTSFTTTHHRYQAGPFHSTTPSSSSSVTVCYGSYYNDPIISSSSIDNVMETSDIIIGIVLAFMLAFLASFLQGRRNQNDFVLGNDIQPEVEEVDDDDNIDALNNSNNSNVTSSSVIFDGESWKEVSDPNTYVLYQGKLRDRDRIRKEEEGEGVIPVERAWVLIAMLALFIPIFSIEFFFALSRQLICGNTSTTELSSFASNLCSPATQLILMIMDG